MFTMGGSGVVGVVANGVLDNDDDEDADDASVGLTKDNSLKSVRFDVVLGTCIVSVLMI